MQIARLYLRVSTAEQDLARQADIEHSARQSERWQNDRPGRAPGRAGFGVTEFSGVPAYNPYEVVEIPILKSQPIRVIVH